MIGWESTISRDYAEAVMNGGVDEDLERMAQMIARRIELRTKPICPICADTLTSRHDHQAITDDGQEWHLIIQARIA